MREYWFNRHYFDTQMGEPITDIAAAQRLESGDPTVLHLGELLLTEDFTFTRGNFEGDFVETAKARIDGWEPKDYRKYGRWVRGLVESPEGEPRPVTEVHLERLAALGLGPSSERIRRHFGVASLAEFREQIGAPVGHYEGRFAHWGLDEFVAHTAQLAKDLGRKPLAEDFDALAVRGKGPGRYLTRRVGGVAYLNDLIGYPDIRSWDSGDFIAWGVRAMRANEGKNLTAAMADILSKRGRGPSSNAVPDLFGSWNNFKESVREHYDAEEEFSVRSRKAKLERYATMVDAGELTPDFAMLSEETLLEIGGRYRLVDVCVPGLTIRRKHQIAIRPSDGLIPALTKLRLLLTAGYVESAAVMLDVFDDVWPMDDGTGHLKISDEELAEVHRRDAARGKARRAAKNAN